MSKLVLSRGWLPIALLPRVEPPSARWIQLADLALSEPFFHQSVKRFRESVPRPTEVLAPLSSVGEIGCYMPARPAGLIFHMSRCGSTLIGNVLRTARRVVVISEAAPLNVV